MFGDPVFAIDAARCRIHIKILVHDLTRSGPRVLFQEFSALGYHTLRRNLVRMKTPSGDYVRNPRPQREGESTRAYLSDVRCYTLGLLEETVTIALGQTPGEYDIVAHISHIPQRNLGIDLMRVFTNVHTVISVPSIDREMNLAFNRLAADAQLHGMIRSATWLVCETEEFSVAKETLGAMDVHYSITPTPIRARDILDVLARTVSDQVVMSRPHTSSALA
jgi:hypothetical protein